MGVIALLDRRRRCAGLDNFAFDRLIVAVEDLNAFAADHRPVTLVQIGDTLGPWRDRKRVGAKIILAVAIADRQRRSHARADDQVGMVAEQEGDGESTGETGENRSHRILRRRAALDLAGDEMTDDLGVGLALECASLRNQLVAQRLEVLDDPIVHQRHRADDVRMGIADGRRAVGRPARMGDPGDAV